MTDKVLAIPEVYDDFSDGREPSRKRESAEQCRKILLFLMLLGKSLGFYSHTYSHTPQIDIQTGVDFRLAIGVKIALYLAGPADQMWMPWPVSWLALKPQEIAKPFP